MGRHVCARAAPSRAPPHVTGRQYHPDVAAHRQLARRSSRGHDPRLARRHDPQRPPAHVRRDDHRRAHHHRREPDAPPPHPPPLKPRLDPFCWRSIRVYTYRTPTEPEKKCQEAPALAKAKLTTSATATVLSRSISPWINAPSMSA